MNSRVVVVAVIEKDGKILLGRKPKDKGPYPNTWHLLGGGVHLDEETLEDAVKREVKEETGLTIASLQRTQFDEDYEPNKHGELTHYVWFVFRVTPTSLEATASDDLEKLKWFSKKDLRKIELNRPTIKLFKEIGLL